MNGMAKAKNIVQRLIDIGAIEPGLTEQVANEVYRMIHRDYIPGGKTAFSATNIRPAPAGHRCALRVGNDPQSGPFYCGEPATLIGDSEDGIICVCVRHERALREIAKENKS